MLVCHCHGITDREIRAQVRAGCTTVKQLTQRCQAATGCRGCAKLVRQLVLHEALECELPSPVCVASESAA